MNFKITFFFATCLIISILKTSVADQFCNDFVDSVLTNLKADKEYFQEPYETPENERSFAVYEVVHGNIFGLSTLHRFDDVTTLKRGKNPYLKVHLAAGEILVKSTIKRKFLAFGRSANVDVTIPFIEMTFDILPKPDGSEPTIKSFKINEIKGLNVKVSGSGLVKDFLLNAFADLVGRFSQTLVKNVIEGKFKDFFKDKVLEYTIPAECLNNVWE